jgi:hypothetical protein
MGIREGSIAAMITQIAKLILTVQRQIFEAARLHQPITGDSVLTSVG